jgi:DNA-binding PadR family transcriptional regulator
MTIRHSLLAIIDQAPCYGHQVRAEFERRTGGSWPLNVGQVYQTLERLVRDKLVVQHDAEGGRVTYAITDAGHAEVAAWLVSPVVRDGRDELAAKLALALTLPGADVAALITAQRTVTAAELDHLRSKPPAGSDAPPVAAALILDARMRAAQAELAWLDHCEASLGEAPPYPVETEVPRRGRPAKAAGGSEIQE